MALFARQAAEVDIIIATALIPGIPAPELITEHMVMSMKPGSIIVDLAAEQGGNCTLTEKDTVITTSSGVTIIGYTNLPSRLANQASQLYSTNVRHLLTELCPSKDGKLFVNMDDDIIRGATVIQSGNIMWPPPKLNLSLKDSKAPSLEDVSLVKTNSQEEEHASMLMSKIKNFLPMMMVALILYGLGLYAPQSFMSHFTVFVLACFVGYQVIWNVSSSLHTPLMSVTNAISGIIVIGALVQVSASNTMLIVLSTLAILLAAINIVGGFLVTQRMLEMFGQ